MTSFLAREIQLQNAPLAFQRIPSTRRICTQEHLHPISSEICGDLLTDVKEMVRESENHQRFQAERLENVLKQTELAIDVMRNPRNEPSSVFNYADDIKFLEQFAVSYKQGVGLSDDAHRHYLVKVSIVLKRALTTLDNEYKNVCPWSLILKVNSTDLCPHRPFCKHKQKYTLSQVPAGHPYPPGGITHSAVMGFCQDEYAVQPGKTKPEGCEVKMYCALQHKEDCSSKANCDAIILYAVACLHRDGLWE
ncbi:uncharacterized protein Bfra_004016 [Botrytis fragariae]|uniref:Uncharacterized protein n=1 Tax=Botrytis fragariae TaxID=1964551 RepID=A0A8H6AXQ4_9HELO|nr:uncharacterized protein Bfra_004016 [Botrytis fragariae]KAF5875563.1 hypothetical protein Bfra_004016 [Botrytis fragariae]